MVSIQCPCGSTLTIDESKPGKDYRCPECGRHLRVACAETLPAGAGEGDSDAVLVQQAGMVNVLRSDGGVDQLTEAALRAGLAGSTFAETRQPAHR
ncbi:MAG: hypothetical protein ABSH20_19240 [Tepidisphaeraceae bacterium]|jgi:hypothetical protein